MIRLDLDSMRMVFAMGRKLTIDDVEIPRTKGLHGHSGADVLFHVLADALLTVA